MSDTPAITETDPQPSTANDAPAAEIVEAIQQITPGDVLDVQVRVRFSVGSATASLREISSIQPGFIFETETRADAPVTIELNGATLGTGELVVIDNRIGVRVREYRGHE